MENPTETPTQRAEHDTANPNHAAEAGRGWYVHHPPLAPINYSKLEDGTRRTGEFTESAEKTCESHKHTKLFPTERPFSVLSATRLRLCVPPFAFVYCL